MNHLFNFNLSGAGNKKQSPLPSPVLPSSSHPLPANPYIHLLIRDSENGLNSSKQKLPSAKPFSVVYISHFSNSSFSFLLHFFFFIIIIIVPFPSCFLSQVFPHLYIISPSSLAHFFLPEWQQRSAFCISIWLSIGG